MTPTRAVILAMLFFTVCALVWAYRVPVENGIPASFNSDEPSHFRVVRYMADHGALPPYTREYYESVHPPLPHVLEALFMRLWPEGAKVYALRLLATLIGLVTLTVVYRTMRLLVSDWSAAVATCLVAALPMFIMFSASVTNDPIAVLLACSTLYVLVRSLQDGLNPRFFLGLCLLVSLGALSKYTLLGLIPVAIGVVVYDSRRSATAWMPRSLALLGVVAITSGWWYVRNVSLYGDPFRAKAEAAMNMFNGSAAPHSVAYWGDALGMLVGSGLGLYPTFPVWPPTIFLTFSVLFGFVLAAAVFTAARRRWTPAKAALGAYGIFAAAVVLAYQVDHFQPHGRLLYPAILVFAWALVGLRHSIPPEKRPLVALASILGLAGLSVALVTSSF